MSALNKGIEVICVLDPRMPPAVRGDGDRLKQVVLNLLSVGPATSPQIAQHVLQHIVPEQHIFYVRLAMTKCVKVL
jgi:nitrogen-specific signal transduction histidine kinase